MEQRRLRLGDILDDYCPRERRVTNHVVVAMIEDDVRQTRCSTCDADHEYKQARVPVTRRKKDAGALAAEPVGDALVARRLDVVESDVLDEIDEPIGLAEAADPADPAKVAEPGETEVSHGLDEMPPTVADDDGPVHRRLIRATLPRPEGQVPERKEMEFTVRQQGERGREADGNRVHGQKRPRRPNRGGDRPGDVRFGSPNGNGPRGGGPGNRNGQAPQGQSDGQPGGHRAGGRPPGDGRPAGENRFRRRRGR